MVRYEVMRVDTSLCDWLSFDTVMIDIFQLTQFVIISLPVLYNKIHVDKIVQIEFPYGSRSDPNIMTRVLNLEIFWQLKGFLRLSQLPPQTSGSGEIWCDYSTMTIMILIACKSWQLKVALSNDTILIFFPNGYFTIFISIEISPHPILAPLWSQCYSIMNLKHYQKTVLL